MQYEGGPIMLDASDPAFFLDPAFGRFPLEASLPGVWESVARGAAVLASSNFIQNLHVQLGDTLTLTTPH